MTLTHEAFSGAGTFSFPDLLKRFHGVDPDDDLDQDPDFDEDNLPDEEEDLA